MPSAKKALPGVLVTYAGSNKNERAGQISEVTGPGIVSARHLGATSDTTGLVFVDVAGTPPAAPTNYFQAIDCVN